jgi:hypothetical protein
MRTTVDALASFKPAVKTQAPASFISCVTA